MTELQQGGNTPVADKRLSVGFSWAIPSGRAVEADASAYLLTASGKVRGDADMVFYNQPDGAGGAVRFGDRTGARVGRTDGPNIIMPSQDRTEQGQWQHA